MPFKVGELPEAEDVYKALDRGETAAAEAWVVSHGATEAWSSVFLVALELMGDRPTSEEMAAPNQASPAARHLCLEGVRLGVLKLNCAHLSRFCEALESLPSPEPVRLGIAQAWSLWAHGVVMDDGALAGLERAAAQAGEARLAVELASLRALHTLLARDLAKSLLQARRASRMARAESIPQVEYLAHLVLARVRRHQGDSHLSARILSGLADVVPPVWRKWLRFEQQLAGVVGEGEDPVLLQLEQAGARPEGFVTATKELRESAGDLVPLQREIDTLVAAITGESPSEELLKWQSGQSVSAPPSLRGILAHGRPEQPAVYVLSSSNRQAKRTLSPGLTLFRLDAQEPGGVFVPSEVARRGARGLACLSALLLAGPNGVDDAVLFESVYGFPYEQEVHRGVFDVLKSRLRAQVDAFGELEKINGQNRISLRRPVAVPDPRCLPSVRTQVLQALAGDVLSAKEVASSLGIALRTAQQALKVLVADGDCEVRKEGRRVRYVLEDTTYSEPTRH